MLKLFLFKFHTQHWNYRPDLSIHKAVHLGRDHIKIENQYAVMKVLSGN